MRLLITGATGFVGKKLLHAMVKRGHEVVVSTRNAERARRNIDLPCQFVEVDPLKSWPQEAFVTKRGAIEGIINLMGENIAAGRWTSKRKSAIVNSRITGTKLLLEGVARFVPQLKFISSASAIGYYPAGKIQELSEDHPVGSGFLAELCHDWEQVVTSSPLPMRKVITRISVVLGRDGGALAKMLPIFKMGMGGTIGTGAKSMSWIHVNDLVNWFLYTAENSDIHGVYNAVAGYCTNREFTKALGKSLHRPTLLPVPPIILKLIFGEMSSIMLNSQKISSVKIKSSGFQFQFSNIQAAVEEIAGNKSTMLNMSKPVRFEKR